uniref:Uncharacterized protein n=1 Tax=Ciona intestinalis TaxID=7719 RepID=H2XZ44_CIOIN
MNVQGSILVEHHLDVASVERSRHTLLLQVLTEPYCILPISTKPVVAGWAGLLRNFVDCNN